MAFIDVKKLTTTYRKYLNEKESLSRVALDDLSLSVKKGDFVAILGPNGSGKSTLARQLCALLAPETGQVLVDGLSTSLPGNAGLIHRKAGIIFQNPDNQIVGNTIEEDVAFGLENLGMDPEKMDKRIDEVLETVCLKEMRGKNPAQLSGGQKQKLAIASVLAMEPECMILDEPLSMIDPESRQEILRTIHDLHRDKKMTIVYITHQIEEVREADHIFIMDEGKVIADGRPADFLENTCFLEEKGLKCRMPRRRKDLSQPSPRGGIALEKVSFSYPGQTENAVDEVTVHVRPGELVAILGKTGSGKSTLLQLMDGLVRPRKGEIFFDGKNILDQSFRMKELRAKVGYSFQYPDWQLFEETVLKDAAFGPVNMGYGKKEAEEMAREALRLTGFPEDHVNDSPLSLSGGEKRKAALAGSLASGPDILLFDEPTAGLDCRGIDSFFELVCALQEKGRGIVFVTHEESYASLYADRILVMDGGKLIYDGEPERKEGETQCFGK